MRNARKAVVLILIILFLMPSCFRSSAGSYRHEAEAFVIHELGIYAGVNTGYFDPDLGSQVQRQTAVILLVKMFGGLEKASAMPKNEVDSILSPYIDNDQLASFARPFMAYAIKTGMVSGTSTSPMRLGPTDLTDSPSLACMILKNMGYSIDTKEEFLLSLDMLGALSGIQPEDIARINHKILIKDDLVGIIYWALRAETASGDNLISSLILDDIIPMGAADEQGLIGYDPLTGEPSITLPDKPKAPADRVIIYDMIRDALLSVSTSVVLPVNSASDTAGEVWDIIEDVLEANPGILYYSGSVYWDTKGLLELKYARDVKTVKSHMDILQSKARSILSSIIKPGMTDYQKELAIHDYIINNCRYDSGNTPAESNTAYGTLCLGTAVCGGYAESVQLLLQMAGVECLIAKDEAAGHAWNIVKIDGQYYHLDVTWDDPVMKDGRDYLTYSYFNLTDGEISKDRKWDRSAYPACTATTYNYYVHNGLVAKGYDAFVAFVVDMAQKGNNFITVKVSDSKDPGFDINKAAKAIYSAVRKGFSMRPIDINGIVDVIFK